MKVAKKFSIPELLAIFGEAGDAFDVSLFIASVCDFYEQVSNARNEEHLKSAGKTFEKVVETFGLVLVMTFMNIAGNELKKDDIEKELSKLENERKPVFNNVDEDKVVQKYLDTLNDKSINKLTKRKDG